jgi:hypothetical protein
LAAPTQAEVFRSDLAVKLRGASYGSEADRRALLADVRRHRDDHLLRLRAYEAMEARDYPHPEALTGADLDQYLVLRGGVRSERFWVEWLDEYLTAHQETP